MSMGRRQQIRSGIKFEMMLVCEEASRDRTSHGIIEVDFNHDYNSLCRVIKQGSYKSEDKALTDLKR